MYVSIYVYMYVYKHVCLYMHIYDVYMKLHILFRSNFSASADLTVHSTFPDNSYAIAVCISR
jgi:hypothetical protein